jgi:acetyltransferase-like isoleucine patch superfamily enzyme
VAAGAHDHRPAYRPDSHEAAVLEVRGGWDYSKVPSNVVLGRDCFIESAGVFDTFLSKREPGMVIGDRVRIYLAGWGSSFTVEPDGLVEIGADSVLVGAQLMCSERISIGRGVVVSYNAVIADSDFHPTDHQLRRRDAISGAPYGKWFGFAERRIAPVVIEDGVKIGINAIVLKGVTIGEGAEVGPGSVVASDVPAGAIVTGNPFTIAGYRESTRSA